MQNSVFLYKIIRKMYRSFPQYLKEIFPCKMQKISLNVGLNCPNRDGSIGRGGCTYCNNRSFNPAYCELEKSVTQQLDEGVAFFAHKYPEMEYLAYFQSYTNTYGEASRLRAYYEEALAYPKVRGLIIATRPDCISPSLMDYFAELSKRTFLLIELGVESLNDETLRLINRGHDAACARQCVHALAARGIPVGIHIILGLPGETREQMLASAVELSNWPITTLKLHQLQLIKDTVLARQVAENPDFVQLFSLDEYIAFLAQYMARLRPDIVLDRFVSQSPKEYLIAPDWGLKNFEFTHRLDNYLRRHGICQGCLYVNHNKTDKTHNSNEDQ